MSNWLNKLGEKWNIPSKSKVLLILMVFALTGFTIAFLKTPILGFITSESNIFYSVLYFIFILPVYNIVLLCYGFLFGQFEFFWDFEKRMFRKISSLFN